MHWIIQFLVRYKNFSSLFLTVFLSLFLLNAGMEKQHQIARTLTVSIFFPFQFTVSQVQRIKNIFADNENLKEKNALLELKLSELSAKEAENKRLRKLIDLDEQFKYRLLSSRTMVREPSYKLRSLVLNKGLTDGVATFMPVVSGEGVVGKVIQVMSGISMVQLITDPSARTSVMLLKNGNVAILKTITGRTFIAKYRTHVDVQEGDTLVTSGLGGIYPRGIKIGTVSKIKESSEPLFKDVYIDPAADFDHLEELFIVLLEPQWSAFREQLDSLEIEE